ncbi:MAG: right-handed parallel beta-helix repeat-containing protein [Lentisphaeria bacterium]|nr:right-handed parallel beta-helix repeat-containing protein [Lentisphaeria bacterium]
MNMPHPPSRFVAMCVLALACSLQAVTHRVPDVYSTIQEAIDAARDGDTVLVAPGRYRESFEIRGKNITVTSRFMLDGDVSVIRKTILDGNRPRGTKRASFVVRIAGNDDAPPRLCGFTIRGGDDGVSCAGPARIDHNYFTANTDAIDYESGAGECVNNLFDGNRDDAIDLDGRCEVLVQNNIIRNSGDDGIEIRLHAYDDDEQRLDTIIRNNLFEGNKEDGIQFIDYPDISNRFFLVENNVFRDTAMAAIGFMAHGNTKESFATAPIPEPIFIFNNTFIGNAEGVSASGAVRLINNLFVATRNRALIMRKTVDETHVAANLFWKNATDCEGISLKETHSVFADPAIDADGVPAAGGACDGAGMRTFERLKKFLDTVPEPPADAPYHIGALSPGGTLPAWGITPGAARSGGTKAAEKRD